MWKDFEVSSLQNFGGSWSKKKLKCIRDYLEAYGTALKNKPFKRYYIDAFAGTGFQTLEASNPEGQLLLETVANDEREIFDGSAKIALDIEPPFHEYVFVEKDPKNYAVLEYLRHDYPEKSITISKQDANEFIRDYCKSWPWDRRAVLFLDPFGLEVDWSSIECIAKTEAIDLWLLFPLGGVMRMLPNDSQISEAWKQKLTRFFGEDAWHERFYVQHEEATGGQMSLLGGDSQRVKTADYKAITDYFVERLKTVFPAEGVVEKPMILYNSIGSPIFLLCFAASNLNGAVIARQIAESTIKG